MPGFGSTFPDPDARTVERYLKFKRVANPASGAAPNEMAAARAQIEKLEAEYPSIVRLAAAADAPKAAPAGQGAQSAGAHGFWSNVFTQAQRAAAAFQRELQFRQTVDLRTRVTGKLREDGKLRITATIDAELLAALVYDAELPDRVIAANVIAEKVAAKLLEKVAGLESEIDDEDE